MTRGKIVASGAALCLSALGCGASKTADLAAIDPALPEGKRIYDASCASCHGPSGAADGPAAAYTYPRPRDFTTGKFKFGGATAELVQTIRRGIPGTAMPAFGPSLSDAEVNAVAKYVRYLAETGSVPDVPFAAPPPPDDLAALVPLGRARFAEACAPCHGPTGRGDGPKARSMTDVTGEPVRPRDLIGAPLKGGEEIEELYERVARGIPGTPMPAFGEAYPDSEIWAIAAFVRELRAKAPRAVASARGIPLARVEKIPRDVSDAAWTNAARAALELHPVWTRPSWPPSVEVTALASNEEVAFLLEWPDEKPDRRLGAVTDFLDAAAVMRPEGEAPGAIAMGGPGSPVRVVQWRAIEGASPAAAHPRTHRDANPIEGRPFTSPARAAGNPLAQLAGREVLAYTAAGPGSLTFDAKAEGYFARGTWSGGRWRVVIGFRGKAPPVAAFAVWDGAAGDRNGRKSITGWFRLIEGGKST